MSRNRPRHNNENQLSKPCNRYQQWGGKCSCYDGEYIDKDGNKHTILEFSNPWCNPDGENGCNCNPYLCLKMRNRWFSSLSKQKQDEIINGKANYYSNCITTRKGEK